MDKNIIKNHLIKRFVSEEATPGISVTAKANKESGKINKAGVAAVAKDVSSYEKSIEKEPKIAPNKFNYTDDNEKTYHDEMEIMNGQEMIQYSSEPGEEFKKRAEEAIEGSSRMGNKIGGNAEAVWGASSDTYGKDLIAKVKDSAKKRADAEIQTYGMGDVQIPTGRKVQTAITAVGAGKVKGDTTKVPATSSVSSKTKVVKENKDKESEEFNDGEDYEKLSREVEYGVNPNAEEKKDNNDKPKIKESMKRITFKKEFEGSNTTQKIGHALTLIPEGYRTNNKEFELSDGNVTCKIRWEGSLTEGKAVVLTSANKSLISEDMNRMKALMGYKSQDTLGLVKGKARVDENAAFGDIWSKTKKLLGESDDIEDADAVEGSAESLDDAVKQAPEAKKHVEGSVSTEKGTQAPAPKKGEWEKISVPQAADAKKHVEGSVAEVKKTEAPAPKVGEWDKINVAQSADAKKHVESGTATHKATDTAKVVKEGIDDEDGDDDAPEVADDYNNPDADYMSSDEAEPTGADLGGLPPEVGAEDDDTAVAVPTPKGGPKLMKSQSTGEHYIMQGNNAIKVSPNFVELAMKNSKNPAMLSTILTKMQDEVDAATGVEDDDEIDEYGDEHHVATADAVAGMKPGAVKEYGDEHPIATKDAVAGMKTGK